MRNKKIFSFLLCLALTGLMIGCGSSESETADSEATTIANPWVTSDRAGVLEATGFALDVPEDATNVVYSYMYEETMAQVTYKIGDFSTEWVYRVQPTNELTDISGMYYEWTATLDGEVAGLPAQCLVYTSDTGEDGMIDDGFAVHVVNWYDAVTGITYSLSASGEGLNGLDVEVCAEEIFSSSQGEATDDADADAKNELETYFLGDHVNTYDESTLSIVDNGDGTYGIEIGITRLCNLENGLGEFSEHKMTFAATDPSGNPIEGVIYRDSDNSLTIEITNSTWEYIANGDKFTNF